jgi:dienelactone hydrolase
MKGNLAAAILFFLVPLVSGAGWRGAEADSTSISFKTLSFESNGKRIPIDLYEPSDATAHPTLLLLYGAGGLVFDGSQMRLAAEQFVRNGYRVYLLHYFNQTRMIAAPPWTMRKNFASWLETVRESIDWIAQQPGSSPRIGIYGFSLGGFLAVAVASDNKHVGAVVEQAGGIADEEAQSIGHMPPLMLVHGERDRWVPFKEYAEPMVAVLQKRGAKFETRFLPEEGHKFKAAALEETRTSAINFFQRNLRAGVE